MPNDYFNHSANVIAAGIRALAAQVNNIATEIGTGLDKLPNEIQFKRGTTRFAVDTGAADAYVVTLPYVPTLVDGFELSFRATNTNTGPSTINANGTGAKAIVYFDKGALDATSILVDSICSVRYSSTLDQYVMQSQSGKVVTIGDADTLDGLDSTQFLRADAPNTWPTVETGVTTGNAYYLRETSLTSGTIMYLDTNVDYTGHLMFINSGGDSSTGNALSIINQGGNASRSLNINHNSTAEALHINNTGTGYGMEINHSGADGLGAYIHTNNAANGNQALLVAQDHVSNTTATVVEIQQKGTGIGLAVNATLGGTVVRLDDLSTVAGTGPILKAYGNNASRTFDLVQITQDHASSTANALVIQQDGSGRGIVVNDNGNNSGGFLGYFYSNNASRTNNVVSIVNDNSSSNSRVLSVVNTGVGVGIEVFADNTGNGIKVSDEGATVGAATGLAYVYANNSSRTNPLVNIIQDHASSTADVLSITQDGTGGRGGYFYSNVASRTVPLVEIVNDHATGSGVALEIQQDPSGPHIDLTGGNGEGIKFTANQTTTDDQTLSMYIRGTDVITVGTAGGTVTLDSDYETIGWTKIGQMCFVQGRIQVTSTSTPTGQVKVEGILPFTQAIYTAPDHANSFFVLVLVTGLMGAGVDGVHIMQIGPSGDDGILLDIATNDISTYLQTGTQMHFNFHYKTLN